MSKQGQTSEAKQPKDNKPAKVEQPVAGPMEEMLGDSGALIGANLGAAGDNGVESQANLLRRHQWQTAQQRAMVARMGHTQGNGHVQRVLAVLKPGTSSIDDDLQRSGSLRGTKIQRQDDPPGGDSDTTFWLPPLDLATAHTCPEAALRLLVIESKLKSLKSSMGDLPTTDVEKALTPLPDLRQKLSREGDLTKKDTLSLILVSVYIQSAYEDGVKAMADVIIQALSGLKESSPGDTSVVEDMLAEELHYAFIDEGDNEYITDLKKGLAAIEKYKGAGDKIVSWATTVTEKVGGHQSHRLLKEIWKRE